MLLPRISKKLVIIIILILILLISTIVIYFTSKKKDTSINIKYSDDYLRYSNEEINNQIENFENEISTKDKLLQKQKEDYRTLENEKEIHLRSIKSKIENDENSNITNHDISYYRDKLTQLKSEQQYFELNDPVQFKMKSVQNDLQKLHKHIQEVNLHIVKNKLIDPIDLTFISDYYAVRCSTLQLPKVIFEVEEEIEKKKIEQLLSNLNNLKKDLQSDSIKIQTKINTQSNNYRTQINECDQKITTLKNINNDSLKTQLIQEQNENEIEYMDKLSACETYIKRYRSEKNKIQLHKACYNIALIIKELQQREWKIDKLLDDIKELIKIQQNLVDSLKNEESDLVEFQINRLKEGFKKILDEINENDSLRDIVRNIFKGQMFNQYFQLGDAEKRSSDFEVRNIIATYKILIPTIKKFLDLYPSFKIFIDGNADRSRVWIPKSGIVNLYGNIDLSMERAQIAKSEFITEGIPDSAIALDWFGEFHNTYAYNPGSNAKYLKDRRVDLQIIEVNSDSKKLNPYFLFKNQFEPISGFQFRHENGYWIQKNYEASKYNTIKIYYHSDVYKKLKAKQNIFLKLTQLFDSPLYKENRGVIELGSQVLLILLINEKIYKIEISRFGLSNINEITDIYFKNFLLN